MIAETDPLDRWRELQRALLRLLGGASERQFRLQANRDLSPLGWHLEHCVFVECLWIRDRLLGDRRITERLAGRSLPERIAKTDRGRRIPESASLLTWARETMERNRAEFARLRNPARDHALLHGDRILHFLITHHAQHLETMRTALAVFARTRQPHPPLAPGSLTRGNTVLLENGVHDVGASDPSRTHDNEFPGHRVSLPAGTMARRPVTNRECASFVESEGYRNPRWWTPAGLGWLSTATRRLPEEWHRKRVEPDAPVGGINRFEAGAYAAWAGGRLPHEHEWEVAHRRGLLHEVGAVWEWCANTLFPYPGFRSFPYREYSTPWFDGCHSVLRGGSRMSEPEVRRVSFRNYYPPDTRHLISGLRVVWPERSACHRSCTD